MKNTIFSIIIAILSVLLVITLVKSLFKLAGSIILIGILVLIIKYLMDKKAASNNENNISSKEL